MNVKEGVLVDNSIELDTLEVELKNTTLLILEGYGGFAMCGALDVGVYNTERMLPRKIVCMKALGVKTLEQLYEAKVYEASLYAKELGIKEGISVKDAFKILSEK